MSTAELASPALIPLQPAALAKMLPPDHYLSERWFERERAVLHDSAWHFACLTSSLTQPGDFRVRQLLDRSVLIIKGDDFNRLALITYLQTTCGIDPIGPEFAAVQPGKTPRCRISGQRRQQPHTNRFAGLQSKSRQSC